MEIWYPPTFIQSLKNKHLLLDTNLFRDAATKPSTFNNFINELKKSDVTVGTIDLVKYELLKGAADVVKYQTKEKLIDDIVDVIIPIMPGTFELAYELVRVYGVNGTQLSVTDLLLGAILMQYRQNIYLLTRDTTDFIQRIFDLPFVINIPHTKGIFTYGIYQYTK